MERMILFTLLIGCLYQGDEIGVTSLAECFSYIPRGNSITDDCLKELRESFCSSSSLKVFDEPANISITTTADDQEFTNLELIYIIAACEEIEKSRAVTVGLSTDTSSFGSSTTAQTTSDVLSTTETSTRQSNKSKSSDIDTTVVVASILSVLLLACGFIIVILIIKLRREIKENSMQQDQPSNMSYNAQHITSTERSVPENSRIVPNMAEDGKHVYSMATDDDVDAVYNHLKR